MRWYFLSKKYAAIVKYTFIILLLLLFWENRFQFFPSKTSKTFLNKLTWTGQLTTFFSWLLYLWFSIFFFIITFWRTFAILFQSSDVWLIRFLHSAPFSSAQFFLFQNKYNNKYYLMIKLLKVFEKCGRVPCPTTNTTKITVFLKKVPVFFSYRTWKCLRFFIFSKIFMIGAICDPCTRLASSSWTFKQMRAYELLQLSFGRQCPGPLFLVLVRSVYAHSSCLPIQHSRGGSRVFLRGDVFS